MIKQNSKWPVDSLEIARDLHCQLKITNKNWHQFKANHERRSAELLSSALIQLIAGGNIQDVEAQIEQAKLWITRKVNDPGCERHS